MMAFERPPVSPNQTFVPEMTMSDPYTWNRNPDQQSYSFNQEQPSQNSYAQYPPVQPNNPGQLNTPIENVAKQQQGLNQPLYPQTSPNSQLNNLMHSITPQDLTFIRELRRESLYTRCLPSSAVSMGALYFFNKSRNSPHKIGHYLACAGLGYIVGEMSFTPVMRKRLQETTLDTPFIQTLRASYKVSRNSMYPISSASVPEFSDVQQSSEMSGWSDINVPVTSFNQSQPLVNLNTQDNDNYAFDSTNSSQSGINEKKNITYDELRRRNRGY